jgi:hypothetical protein
MVYSTYLINMQRWWEDQPSYVFDELSAYANSAEASRTLNVDDRGAIRFAREFIVYAVCVVAVSKSTDTQTREFLRWQIERIVRLSGHFGALQSSGDAEELRVFMRAYFGPTWTRKVLWF